MPSSSMFQRRHYEFLAAHYKVRLDKCGTAEAKNAVLEDADAMARSLVRANVNFKPIRFLQACGISRDWAERMTEKWK